MKDTNTIEIKEEVKLKQEDYEVILEKGDKIKVLDEEFDLLPLMKEVDWKPLIKQANSLDIPVKEFTFKIDNRGEPYYIAATGGFLPQKSFGIFSNAFKRVEFRTFGSSAKFKDNEMVWWADWDLMFELKDGGSNGAQVFTSWYNFTTKKWVFKV